MGRPDASPGVIVGFDHHSDEFNLNEREVNADLRSRCPVAGNEKYGGIWYVSSYDAVEQMRRATVTPLRTSTNQMPPTA